jgi:chemotaxis protein methyltransferase CheR
MELSETSSRILAGLLETRTGQQIAVSRRWRSTPFSAVSIRQRGIGSVDDLITALVADRLPGLRDEVVEALLNNETFFFRDRAAFDLLLQGALPRLMRARAATRRISIWCAGCSTGQEAYSIAMTIAENKARWQGWTFEIVATDISGAAIARARQGLYSQFEVQRGLPVLQMMRWFEEEPGQHWRIAPALRSAVRFQQHSLHEPAPRPGRFDVILCRNVLLYFSRETTRSVFRNLAEASAPDACLMLGAGETAMGHDAFMPDPEQRGLYIRRPEGEALRRAS